jgi:DNA-binding MarR family transcriptional regulator
MERGAPHVLACLYLSFGQQPHRSAGSTCSIMPTSNKRTPRAPKIPPPGKVAKAPAKKAVKAATPAKAAAPASASKGARTAKAATARGEPNAAHAEHAAKVLRRFRVIFNAVKNHFRSVERKAGISGAQVWALSVVNASPGAGMNQLAKAMDLHQSTASNLVRTLVASGMLVSAREGEDRRAVQLYLTTKGHKVLAKVPGPFTGILPEALMLLDTQTLERLDRDLLKVVRSIDPNAHGENVPIGYTD